MRRMAVISMIFALLALSACETQMNEPATGALLGGGAGAGLGAIIGNQSGNAGVGTAIGAGSGALLGALIGEANRRNKEQVKREIREEMAGQQGYYPRPPAYSPQPQVQDIHTKYNPKTGQTFPERYKYDPATGDELHYIQ